MATRFNFLTNQFEDVPDVTIWETSPNQTGFTLAPTKVPTAADDLALSKARGVALPLNDKTSGSMLDLFKTNGSYDGSKIGGLMSGIGQVGSMVGGIMAANNQAKYSKKLLNLQEDAYNRDTARQNQFANNYKLSL